MRDRDQSHLEEMNEETEFIVRAVTGVSKDEFLKNDLLQRAICMAMINIGECTNRLSDEFTEKHDELPWIQMVGLRNVTAHGYRSLDMELVWKTVTTDIPKLRQFLAKFVR
jgi:uncharacterized protein with HEPN domain